MKDRIEFRETYLTSLSAQDSTKAWMIAAVVAEKTTLKSLPLQKDQPPLAKHQFSNNHPLAHKDLECHQAASDVRMPPGSILVLPDFSGKLQDDSNAPPPLEGKAYPQCGVISLSDQNTCRSMTCIEISRSTPDRYTMKIGTVRIPENSNSSYKCKDLAGKLGYVRRSEGSPFTGQPTHSFVWPILASC